MYESRRRCQDCSLNASVNYFKMNKAKQQRKISTYSDSNRQYISNALKMCASKANYMGRKWDSSSLIYLESQDVFYNMFQTYNRVRLIILQSKYGKFDIHILLVFQINPDFYFFSQAYYTYSKKNPVNRWCKVWAINNKPRTNTTWPGFLIWTRGVEWQNFQFS